MPSVTRARSGRTTGGAGGGRSSGANTKAHPTGRSREKAAGARPARAGAGQPRITGECSAQVLDLAPHLAAREGGGVDIAVHRARAEAGQQLFIRDAGDVRGLEAAFVELAVEG